jgi:Histidine kinase-, DNA gyrase B-, and HSP90-like ATPase
MLFRHISAAPALAIGAVLLAGCGGSSSSSTGQAHSSGGQSAPGASQSSSAGQSAAGGAGALSAEAKSAATGDIPDNQQFLTFRDAKAGFRISYPEGWAQRGGSSSVTFQNNNNLIRIVVQHGAAPTPAQVTAALAKERARRPSAERTLSPIVENAVSHATERVEVAVTQADGALVFAVSDDGPGIDPDVRERIFQPGVSLSSSAEGRGSGAGLGLPLARRLAEAAGGRVQCTSVPAGASFRIRFPLE